ncbi:WD40-repeat-containing domain protein [Haematococcus lacustris]
MPASPKKDPMKGKKGKTKGNADQSIPQDYLPPPLPLPGDDFAMPVREIIKPDNQLRLTETELAEEIAKILTANNPAAPKNVARFNMKERVYKFEPMVDQTIIHYSTDGWLLHKGSEEAKRQMDMEKMEQEASTRFQAEVDKAHHDKRDDGDDAPDDSRQLRNQFNFSERAAQTLNYPLRDRETFTEPPPTATVSGSCTQYEIYDEYIHDLERQKLEESLKSKGGKKGAAAAPGTASAPHPHTAASNHYQEKHDVMQSEALAHATNMLDRMANQNMYEEISMDFKYWEDASDAYRPGEGSLLPLWKFTSDKARRRQVTSICWSPQYLDMFAVGYGSYDFLKQSSGLINIFSLKNPSHPEYSFSTESGAMSLHFHPEYSNLLAVGCYDGSVLVYDVRVKGNTPIYKASVRTGKHNDPVWAIFWQVDEAQRALQFVSISSDGNINLWTMNKSELSHEVLMKLRVVVPPAPGAAAAAGGKLSDAAAAAASASNGGPVGAGGEEDVAAGAGGSAGGCCMDFNKAPGQDHNYLVGTEEGAIHKCSKAYSSEYLSTYLGHSLAVYAVKWNNIHHRTFLSASADWSVKLWDAAQPRKPVMSFDLNDTVGDIAWAPYSATVFAAVTDDGKVHVFDLNENKLLPMCSQKVVKKARLTKLLFNPKWPVILVGDDKGCVTSLKLSPNLRRRCIPEKGQKETAEDLEVGKLERVMDVARRSDPEVHASSPTPAGSQANGHS